MPQHRNIVMVHSLLDSQEGLSQCGRERKEVFLITGAPDVGVECHSV